MHFNNFSRKQEQALCWWLPKSPYKDYDAIICDGAVRSGKTLCMSMAFILWAMENFNGLNFGICGKTIASCRRNVITPLQELITSELGMSCHYSLTLGTMEVTGAKSSNLFYVFGGKDEGSAALIQGVTLAGVLLDEVALMPQSFVEQALARCSVTGSKFWFNCNPEGPMHWFYQDWVLKHKKKNALYLHFTMDDNPSLSPKVKQRYESLYAGVFRDRYIKGLWVMAEGLVYPMFSDNLHVIPENMMPHNRMTSKQLAQRIQPYDKYWISGDYGTMNPSAFILWGQRSEVYYAINEYYYDGRALTPRTDEEHYDELEKLAGNLPISGVIIDPSAASFITLIRRRKKFKVIEADNAVLDGIRECATALKNNLLKFSSRCKRTIGEFKLYSWNSKKAEDEVIKANDHAMDAVRYFVRKLRIAVLKKK